MYKDPRKLLILICLVFSGCASDQPLVPMPTIVPGPPMKPTDNNDIGFEDISLAASRRLQVLTNKMEIDKQTNNYINNGQADVITRPDGTILFPYGLAQVN